MRSKVIIYCVLLFCSKFVASNPFNEDSVRQWHGNQNTAENYHGTGFARTQNINSMTNSAQYANSQEYNANQGRQIYDNYRFTNQASPMQALPVKEAVSFATDDVQAYPIRTDNTPIRVNNQQYPQQQWQHQNRFVNSASSANAGYVGGYNRPLISAQPPHRPFINGPGHPNQYIPNHQHLHYHPVRAAGSRPGPVRYENYNEPHVIASNMNRVPGNNGYGGNLPPYNNNGAIPANVSPNNENAGYIPANVSPNNGNAGYIPANESPNNGNAAYIPANVSPNNGNAGYIPDNVSPNNGNAGYIPDNVSPNNGNAVYREGPVINPGPNYPKQNTFTPPIAPPNLSPGNNGPAQNIEPFNKYPEPYNPAPINNFNEAPILPNPNGSPLSPPIPSDGFDGNYNIPIDKIPDSYKNPGESYPDAQLPPANPGPPGNANDQNLYHHYSTTANQGNINDFLASSKVKDLLSDRNNRYMILHPNGTIDYIDKLDDISQKYPNYIVVNKNNNTSTAVSPSQPSHSPSTDGKPAPNILGPLPNDETDSSPQSAPTRPNNSNIPLFPHNHNYRHQQGPLTHNSSPGAAPSKDNHYYHPYNPTWDKNPHSSKHPTPVFTTTTIPPTPDAEALKEFLDSLPNDNDNNSATTPAVPSGSDYNPTRSPVWNDNDNDDDEDKNANEPPNAPVNLPTTTTLADEDLLMKQFLDSLKDQSNDDEPSNNDNDSKNDHDSQYKDNSFTTQPWKLHTVISPGIFRKTTPSSKYHTPSDVTISPIETTTDQIITLSPIETATDNVKYETLPNCDDQDENNNSKSSSKTNTNVHSGKDDTLPGPHKAIQHKVDENDYETTKTDDKNKKTTAFIDSLTKTDAPATYDDSSAVTTIAPNRNDVNTGDSSTTGDNLSELKSSDIKLSIDIPDDPNGNITISIEVPESAGYQDGPDSGTIILTINTPDSSSKNTTSTSSDDDDSTDNGFDKNKSHVIDLLNSVVVCSTTNSTDIMNKMNANNSSCNVMYVIQMAPPNQPRIEKNKETTYFANGTVVEEYTETTWQDENTPVTVTMKKVYHRDPVH